jgi:hypothetical protein
LADSQHHRDSLPAIDPNRANVARIFNALLGGKDNYQADRDVRDRCCSARLHWVTWPGMSGRSSAG